MVYLLILCPSRKKKTILEKHPHKQLILRLRMVLNCLIFFEIRLRRAFAVASYRVTSCFSTAIAATTAEQAFEVATTQKTGSVLNPLRQIRIFWASFFAFKFANCFSLLIVNSMLRKHYVHKMQFRWSFLQSISLPGRFPRRSENVMRQ